MVIFGAVEGVSYLIWQTAIKKSINSEFGPLRERANADFKEAMIPPKSDSRWEKLIKKETHFRFRKVAVSMLLHRLNLKFMKDPSEDTVRECVDELHGFLTKYEAIFGEDLNAFFNHV